MVLVQILLPAPGTALTVPPEDYALTRAELLKRFSGVTAYLRSPGQGNWIAPSGRADQDDIVMVEVVTDTFDREWWRGYSQVLARRFHQDAIHLRAIPVEVLDTSAS
ncbi:MAG: hypothetical protein ABI634_16990 [Acidobacteriota bacterium]